MEPVDCPYYSLAKKPIAAVAKVASGYVGAGGDWESSLAVVAGEVSLRHDGHSARKSERQLAP